MPGREISEQEIAEVLSRKETRIAAFSNGAQTALLNRMLPGGPERIVAGGATRTMTVLDFLSKGGRAAIRDAGLKAELMQIGKTMFADYSDEAIEEGVNQALDEVISTAALGKDMKLGDLLEESFKDSMLGGLVGSVLPPARVSKGERIDPLDVPVKVPLAPTPEQKVVAELVTPEVQATAPLAAAAALATPEAPVSDLEAQPIPVAENASLEIAPAEPVTPKGQSDTQVAETPTPIKETPALEKDKLKDTFNLTDEQADAAVEVSRALSLSPDRVSVEREFAEVVEGKPPVAKGGTLAKGRKAPKALERPAPAERTLADTINELPDTTIEDFKKDNGMGDLTNEEVRTKWKESLGFKTTAESIYEAALEKSRQASREFGKAQESFKAKNITAEEYAAAFTKHKEAQNLMRQYGECK